MGDSGDLIRLKLRKAKKLKLPQREDVGRALTLDEETAAEIHPRFIELIS
jgi:hypothetical protein